MRSQIARARDLGRPCRSATQAIRDAGTSSDLTQLRRHNDAEGFEDDGESVRLTNEEWS
jgi:hypothetical protein